ncbi:hypothetical protein VCHA50O407_150001 [Vibrio chagasii]|nr:hypothetical protein VCHA50O407_150001 [Vibrio chagasii]CAH6991807.1 hypothetical protein VCHA50P424_130001 [Vibrio chagasii]CAH7240940.1 hypothetical protein VCHA49P379_310002 [Vibrio chagasii]
MKFHIIAYMLLALTLGFASGVWFGVGSTVIIVEEVPTKSALDLVAIVFTILGGGATFVATIFAIYAYSTWKLQQKESTLIGQRVKIVKSIFSLQKSIAKLLYRSGSEYEDVKKYATLLADELSEIHGDLEIYYALKLSNESQWSLSEACVLPIGDSLDDLKEFLLVSTDLYRLQFQWLIDSSPFHLRFKSDIPPNLAKILDLCPNENGTYRTERVVETIRKSAELCAESISKENDR